jgi:hypothetical protein
MTNTLSGQIERLQRAEREVAHWRQDAAARLWGHRVSAQASEAKGDLDRAADLRVNVISPTVAALRQALSGDFADFHCEACGGAIEEGDEVFSDTDCGFLHARCVGQVTGTEGFVDPDGEPLAADAPVPTPFVFASDFTDARIAEELAAAQAYLNAPDAQGEGDA